MRTQIPISTKVDASFLGKLNQECSGRLRDENQERGGICTSGQIRFLTKDVPLMLRAWGDIAKFAGII